MIKVRSYLNYEKDEYKAEFLPSLKAFNGILRDTISEGLSHHYNSVIDGKYNINLFFVGDKYIHDLNLRYRKKDKPTNVLSFALFKYTKDLPINDNNYIDLGDIVFSIDTVIKESEEQNKLPLHHFTHLLIHAALHLCGFDHALEETATIMENLEIKCLQKLGIGNPYFK